MNISHLSRTLVCGDASKETVMKEISEMPGVSQSYGVYCLKGSEALILETRRRLICDSRMGGRYEALPFVRQDAYMAYELLRQKPYALFGGRI